MTTPTTPGQLPTITADQAKAACERFMSKWGPDEDEDEDEPNDHPYEFGDSD